MYVKGQIYKFPEGHFEGGGAGYYRCTDDNTPAHFEKVRSLDPVITIKDINTDAGICDEGNWLVFPDGRSKERSTGVKQPSPADPLRKAQAIVYFWRLKLELELECFTNYKQTLIRLTQARQRLRHPAPEPEALDKLAMAKARVLVVSKKLQQVEAERDAIKGVDKMGQECETANADFLSIARAIEV